MPYLHCPDPDSLLEGAGYRTGEVDSPGPLVPYACVSSAGISEPASYPVVLLPELSVGWSILASLALLWALRGLRP